ncbi:unnamed protein product, partial [Pylaiella littoralis]
MPRGRLPADRVPSARGAVRACSRQAWFRACHPSVSDVMSRLSPVSPWRIALLCGWLTIFREAACRPTGPPPLAGLSSTRASGVVRGMTGFIIPCFTAFPVSRDRTLLLPLTYIVLSRNTSHSSIS